jgi:carboxyl-terminal processing protease
MVARPLARARFALVALFVFSLIVVVPSAPTSADGFDLENELSVVKSAYDALHKNLYKEPDTAGLLTNAHIVVETTLKTALPLDDLGTNPDKQWEVFAQNVRTMVGQSSVTLAHGDLAYPLVKDFAKTIGDLHTYFLDPKQADAAKRALRGDTSIVNFGFTSMNISNSVYIRQVVPNSPIEEAGARNGDRVISVDGKDLTPDTRVALLGSPQEGQDYAISVQHVNDASPTTITVHMHRYVRLALTSKVLDGHIGYIQTFAFYDSIPDELDKALTSLHTQNVDSLIIDFRGNAGGTNVDEVMGRFLSSGSELGAVKGRSSSSKQIARSDGKKRETLPTVILVDDGSGSASEIAALAFHDYDRATSVGKTTAGALGSTRPFNLGDGSAISITIAIYTSAKGESVNGTGYTPDIVVDRTNDDLLAGRDPQLDAAITRANAISAPQPSELPLAA